MRKLTNKQKFEALEEFIKRNDSDYLVLSNDGVIDYTFIAYLNFIGVSYNSFCDWYDKERDNLSQKVCSKCKHMDNAEYCIGCQVIPDKWYVANKILHSYIENDDEDID